MAVFAGVDNEVAALEVLELTELCPVGPDVTVSGHPGGEVIVAVKRGLDDLRLDHPTAHWRVIMVIGVGHQHAGERCAADEAFGVRRSVQHLHDVQSGVEFGRDLRSQVGDALRNRVHDAVGRGANNVISIGHRLRAAFRLVLQGAGEKCIK